MAEISKITLPSGSTYDLKDSWSRDEIAKLQSYSASGVQYVGVTTTALADGDATTTTISINGEDHTVKQGEMVSYNNVMFAWNGSQWDQLGTAGAFHTLAYKDSVSASYTPAGTVDAPVFKGKAGDISATGKAAGTISEQKFKGTAGDVSVSGTPAGTVTVSAAAPADGETGNYTPAGKVTLTPVTDTVKAVDSVGTLPALSATVADETLSLGFDAGTLPTTKNATVMTSETAAFEGTATMLKSSFKGDALNSTGTFTPAGTVDQATFTGGDVTVTGTFTPDGDVTAPAFKGTATTVVSE